MAGNKANLTALLWVESELGKKSVSSGLLKIFVPQRDSYFPEYLYTFSGDGQESLQKLKIYFTQGGGHLALEKVSAALRPK